MTKKQKNKFVASKLLYEWKKEQPDEFYMYVSMTDNESKESMAGLLTWLITSNRVSV